MVEVKTFGNLTYYIRKPDDFDENKQYPVIFNTHGAGSRGRDIAVLRSTGVLVAAEDRGLIPDYIVIAPQCFADTWFDIFEQLQALVAHIYSEPYTDKTRFYGSGGSMGGYTMVQLMMSRPEFWAAGIICCGGGMYWNAARLKHIPLWFFTGAKDTVVFPTESIHMANAVNRAGGVAKLTVLADNEHNCWDYAFLDSGVETYAWLGKQRKGD